jgi:tetratricopeptide (TPR) repeat protein
LFVALYNLDNMNAKLRIFSAGFILMLGATLCLSQAAPDRQREFAAHIQKAQDYLRQKRPDLAIPELQAASEINPEDAETQGNLGVLLYFQGKFADAIPHLRVALENQPALIKIQGLLGIAEVRTLDFADARKDMEASFPQIVDKKFKVELGLELVGLYTQTSDLDQAASTLAQLRKFDPENAEVLYAAYRTYSDLSSESMMALALAAPDSAQMHQILAHEEIKEGNTNGAIAQYRKAMAIDPKLPGIHFELAELLNTSQDASVKKEAEQEYRQALAVNPLDEKAECRLGEIDATRGNTSQAYEEFSRAVALQPADSDAKLDLAKTLVRMNQLDSAQGLLEETIKLEPTNAIAHYRLGTLYQKQRRVEDAKREVELYKKYKEMKEKLHAIYKELMIQPAEIRADEPDQK